MMNKLDIFILSLFQHGDKARYSSVAHLLRGKRTSSILTYGFFYDILPYFSLMPKLTDKTFNGIVEGLINQKNLLEVEPGVVKISLQGCLLLSEEPVIDHQGLNSFFYGRSDDDFLELLLFATQVVSEYCHNHSEYQPIETNNVRQALIKKWFRQLPLDRKKIGQSFYEEWHRLISSFPEVYREYVLLYLSGHQQIGQTLFQLANLSGKTLFDVQLIKKQLSHIAIKRVVTESHDFPYMDGLYRLLGKATINQSALRTYNLFQGGVSLHDICHERRLKISTVTDHLIEWAILDCSFPFESILTDSVNSVLVNLLNTDADIRSWQYSDLGEQQEAVSFLAFRCFQLKQIRKERGE